MTAHVAECGISSTNRDVLSQKLRPNLLALKQFETTYILARWIRNLFMDIINKPVRQALDQRSDQRDRGQNTDSHGRFEQDSSMTPESFLRSHHQSAETSEQGTSSTHNSYSTGEGPPHTSAPDDGTFLYNSNSYDHSTSPSVIMGNFVPNFITNEFLPPQQGNGDMSGMNMIDFPSPSTLEYQSLHFLADIGLSGFQVYQ